METIIHVLERRSLYKSPTLVFCHERHIKNLVSYLHVFCNGTIFSCCVEQRYCNECAHLLQVMVDAMLLSDLKWGGTTWKFSGPVLDIHNYRKEMMMMMKSLFIYRLLKFLSGIKRKMEQNVIAHSKKELL